MLKLFKKIDKHFEERLDILILLLIVVLLRIPNFFEPYWYGDEAIYLTVGTGIRQGLKLYSEIIDHKTPLIYYLATTPTQLHFRLLNLGWMLATTTLFFKFAKFLFRKTRYAFAAGLIFVALTSLPWFEGNIPNGELFVMGFVMAGFWILSKTRYFRDFLNKKTERTKKDFGLLIWSGVFFGLGILTKVPALLDFAAALVIGWFVSIATLKRNPDAAKKISIAWKTILKNLKKIGILFLGVMIPILISIIYYNSIGSGRDYLDYGLLYNFRYSGSWQLAFESQILQSLFTLPGKVLILSIIMLVLSFYKKLHNRFKFAAAWFSLALFASLLSNRPYPHYFQQLVPPFSLLVIEVILMFKNWKTRKQELLVALPLMALPVAVILTLNVALYPTVEYYSKFFDLVSNKITVEEYDTSFNSLIADNYKVAPLIKGLGEDRIFIWGTNPMLYAMTQTTPTSRFTVAFHIEDFKDHERTLNQIKEEKPKIIVVMKDHDKNFPTLNNYLNNYYLQNTQYENMTLYLRNTVNN